MRKFTQREKILLAVVAVVAVVVLFMAIKPTIRRGFSGGELTVKRQQLQTAQNLVSLARVIEQINGKIRSQVGLEGQIISVSLFKEISDRVDLEDLNRARRAADLTGLLPVLEGKADTLLSYKKQNGEFESLNVLKEIRGPLFEGEQPQAVISQRISDFVQKAKLKPNYQLNIKPMPGKKSEKLSNQAKENLIHYLYLSELAAELEQLQAEQKAVEEEVARRRVEAEELIMDAMYDAWWGDADEDATGSDQQDAVATQSGGELVKGKINEESQPQVASVPRFAIGQPPSSREDKENARRQFVPLPAVIPLALRIQLLQFIQSNLEQQMGGVAAFKRGFLDDQIAIDSVEVQGGFLGIGTKKRTNHVKFKPNALLLWKFETLINRYEDEQAYDTEGEVQDTLDYEQQLHALTQYADRTLQNKKQLQDWLAMIPSTYQPEVYIVDMNFNGEIDKVVRLIQAIESTAKWLQVRDLRVSGVVDKKKNVLGVNLSMVAKIL